MLFSVLCIPVRRVPDIWVDGLTGRGQHAMRMGRARRGATVAPPGRHKWTRRSVHVHGQKRPRHRRCHLSLPPCQAHGTPHGGGAGTAPTMLGAGGGPCQGVLAMREATARAALKCAARSARGVGGGGLVATPHTVGTAYRCAR